MLRRNTLNVRKTRVCSKRSINAVHLEVSSSLQVTSLPLPLPDSSLPAEARFPAGPPVWGAPSSGPYGARLGPGVGRAGDRGRPRRSHVAGGARQSRSSSARVGGRARQGVPRARTAGGCARDPGARDPRRGTARWVARPGGVSRARPWNSCPVGCIQGEPALGRCWSGQGWRAPSASSPAASGVRAAKVGVRAWSPTTSSTGADAPSPVGALEQSRLRMGAQKRRCGLRSRGLASAGVGVQGFWGRGALRGVGPCFCAQD